MLYLDAIEGWREPLSCFSIKSYSFSSFYREHNRLAESISSRMPNLEDESVFQLARKILIAELQNIVYTEYLPLVLGRFRRVPAPRPR